MDPDVRASHPGTCTRCGMALVQGVPDLIEYPLDLGIEPSVPRAAENTRLTFALTDPRTRQPVRRFEIVHEQFYHAFVVSDDLSFFLHAHPVRQSDEDFHLDVRFPKPGMYRVLSDFYPVGGTPQLIPSTVIVPGGRNSERAAMQPDLSPKQTENANVKLKLVSQVTAGARTSMRFTLSPNDGLEPYLGTWGHMLAASADLIDMMHSHPFSVTDTRSTKELEFDMAFPRPGIYRVWLQFKRLGVVNTVAFNIPVETAAP
jgi:hypothetical protein